MNRPVDAMVIGAGPNGLVAANMPADQGWDVVVMENEPDPGGAVRSGQLLEPGFVTDRFSAFYPLSIVSSHIRSLDLHQHGLKWCHAPHVLAHPTDAATALLSRDVDVTAESLDRFAAGDGEAWVDLQHRWDEIETDLIDAFMSPSPPLRAAGRLAASLGVRDLAELSRDAVVPVKRFASERFDGVGAGLLLAGSALHADRPHRACGVETDDGDRVVARHGVLADVVAPALYLDLLDRAIVPARTVRDIGRYQRGSATFKVNWTLDGPIPWLDPAVGRAGTVSPTRSTR